MQMRRSSGVLLHLSSLPDSPGIGTLGENTYKFVDWLVSAKQSLWQVLPIGPTGYGDSPYASFSTFAGNPLLIDLERLVEQNILTKEEAVAPNYISYCGYVDYGSVVYWKLPLLKVAAKNFLKSTPKDLRVKYEAFKNDNASWLDNYSIFMSIKEFYDKKASDENIFGAMWSNYWPSELRRREPKAVSEWHSSHVESCEIQKAIQFFFFEQWFELKSYANKKGISIIGDIPIFVAPDSADVWANQNLFQLDEEGQQLSCAGVPPDYFSATGQMWGNPLYDWDEMKKQNYDWWLKRISYMSRLVDFVRIDHFRGFDTYWKIPAGEKTAVKGQWCKGPGADLLNAIQSKLSDIPIIAEDLGIITDSVKKLRDDFNLPGMRILQFAFDTKEAGAEGLKNPFLPHNYISRTVAYTGTHDNATMQGWLLEASDEEIKMIADYIGLSKTDDWNLIQQKKTNGTLCKMLIELIFSSVADFAIVPLQDIFCLGNEARMNVPSTTGGHNWQWRMSSVYFDDEKAEWLKGLSEKDNRNK